MMKKKMLAVAVCVSMCMMAFAGCTSESGGGSDKKAEQTEGKKEEKDLPGGGNLETPEEKPHGHGGALHAGGHCRAVGLRAAFVAL